MKKKILFCLQTMVMGGVEKELITVLNRLNPEVYEVELLLFYVEDEEMVKAIPSYVKLTVLDLDKSYWCCNARGYVLSRLKHGKLLEASSIAVQSILGGGTSSAYVKLDTIPEMPEIYDTAICYHMHSAVVLRYVAEKIRAKRKVAWIHNDFNVSGFRVERYQKALSSYQRIVAVSERLREEFAEHCPQIGEKAVTVHNVVDVEKIREMAEEPADELFAKEQRKRIVTVGRYVEQKGYDIAIEACKLLVENGLDIAWFAIGWGPEEEHLRELVLQYQLENHFYIVGRKNNPYSYIAGADLYVQPSRHEGYPITICEAIALKRYMIATDFAGAKEQITNEGIGIVIDSFEPKALADTIAEKIENTGSTCEVFQDDWERLLQILSA